MNSHYDPTTNRIVVTEPADPLMAVAVVGFAVLCVVVWIAVWSMGPIRDAWAAITGWVILVGFAVYLVWVAMRDLTKVVATFDGTARTLTVTRSGLLRRTEQSFPYKDIVRVATGLELPGTMVKDGFELAYRLFLITFRKYHRFQIVLTGGRAVELRANSHAESGEAVRQAHLAMSNASSTSSSGSSAP
jgi:hypothetical protein